MKIQVLKNFGLNGEDLAAGSVAVVKKSDFGDNEKTFREEGYFVDFKDAQEPENAPKRGRRDPEEPAVPDAPGLEPPTVAPNAEASGDTGPA